ncbi:MAG TPA: hypothetical protein ENN29_09930 [Candidatus Hydrogenedentes bacterium]|nr:hypothetical protein [Candidatus Hydrogenedentota bacterium]
MATCIQIETLLQSYVDNEASASERLVIEEHLNACRGCSDRLQSIRKTAAIAYEILRQDQLPEDMTNRVMAHLPDMTPVVPVNAYSTRHAPFSQRKIGQWLGAVGRLIPVFTPIILLILTGLLWVAWPTYNAGDENTLGMVMHCDGDAVSHVAFGRARKARVQGDITIGDRFRTGEKSRLLLGLEGPSHITVFENTAIEVRAPRDIVLLEGRVFFDVFREARHFHVYTPDGRITVLGTSFHVDIQNAGTEVTVVNGEVMLENDNTFLRLHNNTQALVSASQAPVIRQDIDTSSYVRHARSVRPDPAAERRFLTRLKRDGAGTQPPTEQVFVVETGGRPVRALLLRWTPDPYTEGHAGYTVYVSDNSMTPLFKKAITPETFRNKTQNMMRVDMPLDLRDGKTEVLHITIMPEKTFGLVETTFTEVAAIGGAF